MFTHKATGAWDALTKGLIEAGFVISASWPVNTEAEGSGTETLQLHVVFHLAPKPSDSPSMNVVRHWKGRGLGRTC